MDARAREMVTGVYQLPERLLLVLDVNKTADLAERSIQPATGQSRVVPQTL
jgi:hypothetical protein